MGNMFRWRALLPCIETQFGVAMAIAVEALAVPKTCETHNVCSNCKNAYAG
jgi:hypothetical protein